MREVRRSSGVVIGVPDAYEEPAAATASRGRRRAADDTTRIPNFEAVDAALIEALLNQDMGLVDEFEYEVNPRRARSPQGQSVGEQTLSVSMAAQPGETALVLVEQDGVYSWQFPVAALPAARGSRRRRGEEAVLRFEIPLSEAARGGDTRSVFSAAKDLAGRIKAKVLKTATDQVLGLLEAKVERGLVVMKPEGLQHWTHLADPSQLELPSDRESRILLFVHGTFSTTVGSFHSLSSLSDDALFADLWKRYDAVIGFDHPTLSVDPEQNAIEILQAFKRANAKGIVFDAVSYSRGGLVLRSLVETLLPSSGVPARMDKAVFVGATNEGTALAEPDNWRDFIDVYTNLALGAARAAALLPNAAPIATVVGGVVKGLGAIVKFLVDHAIEDGAVPGLAAMEPDGDFVRRINQTQPGQPGPGDVSYYAVTSNFESGASAGGLANELPAKFLMRAADPVVDRLMRNEPNDLVVNTASMTAIDRAGGNRTSEALEFGENSVVYHTVYFTQDALADRLRSWLSLGEAPARRGVTTRSPIAQVAAKVVTGPAITPPPPPALAAVAVRRPVLDIEVVWDDIRHASGDVYAAGHYLGVAPQRAEWALDSVVSDSTKEEDLVLTQLTRSNVLRGELGDISFFPWGGRQKRNRLIAVCGMGRYGPFGSTQLRRLHYNFAQSLMALPDPRTICMVLIGAGEGAMRTEDACTQLVMGFGDAMRATARDDRIRRIRVVELFKSKAEEIYAALEGMAKAGGSPVDVRLTEGIAVGGRGRVTDETARTLLVRAVSLAGHDRAETTGFEDLAAYLPAGILDAIHFEGDDPDDPDFDESPLRRQLRTTWQKADGDIEKLTEVAPRGLTSTREPQRISFFRESDAYSVSAITDNATVPERPIRVDPALIGEAVAQMTDPLPAAFVELSALLFRLTLPRGFRELMAADAPLVFEVDRNTASLHWEMLASGIGGTAEEPIGLIRPIARQLRTQYSETIAIGGGAQQRRINVLVIGDPGDPDQGLNLPHARAEARQVARYLSDLAGAGVDIEVQQLIGSPNYPDRGVPPATRFEVLRRLMRGGIDVVHYSGHGGFDPADPSRSGWLFHDGLLTAGEIERVDVPPAVVFANACLTGRVSTATAGGTTANDSYAESGLLPSLADEFLNRGVRNYIGTAWEIDDAGAVEFAKAFYGVFFTPQDGEPTTIGDALLAARRALHQWELTEARDLVLWPAYQHYGDPGFRSTHL